MADGGVLPRRVFKAALRAERHHLLRAAHQRGKVDPRNGNGEQTYGGQHAVAPADVIRNDKFLVALLIGKGLECAAVRVGRGVDALRRLRAAVFALQLFAEEAEGDGGFGGRAGLGDDVDGKVLVADEIHHLVERVGREAVADEVDVRGGLFLQIVVGRAEALDHAARTQIAAADADDDERAGVGLDLLRRSEDARVFILIIVARERDPAEEVAALSAAVLQPARRALKARQKRSLIRQRQEGRSMGNIDRQHDKTLLTIQVNDDSAL